MRLQSEKDEARRGVEISDPARPERDPRNTGHGHVFPRPDGVKMRCGGPGICQECAMDAVRKAARQVDDGQDAQRWRKARTLPRSWWRDAFNRIAAEGVTLDDLIDAETKRRLP